MKYKVTLINLPSSKSLISFAAWIPSSFKFFSMSLDRATAALSSADMAQPIFGSFQPVRRDNAEALFNKCEKNGSGRQLIMSLNLLLLCAYSVLYFVLIKKKCPINLCQSLCLMTSVDEYFLSKREEKEITHQRWLTRYNFFYFALRFKKKLQHRHTFSSSFTQTLFRISDPRETNAKLNWTTETLPSWSSFLLLFARRIHYLVTDGTTLDDFCAKSSLVLSLKKKILVKI